MSHSSEVRRVEITTLARRGDEGEEMRRDVCAGLGAAPRDLSPWPKYLYDDEGSRLFEEITAQPEYYQTRTEASILEERADEIVARCGCQEIVELGSGSSAKTPPLIEALLDASDGPATYCPLDVSEGILRESGARLNARYPDLRVRGYVGDFDGTLGRVFDRECEGRLVVFLGGTIGNFTPRKRTDFLAEIAAGLGEGDYLLLGVDLVKDRKTLEAAYDDEAGVTAAFNKNLLNVLNDRVGSDFDPSCFDHRAIFDEKSQRIEMWLDATQDQRINLPDLALDLEEGEGIRTEISHKFTAGSADDALAEAGLDLMELYTDERDLFGLALAGVSRQASRRAGRR